MNEFLEILKYILPSTIILVATYLILKSFLESEQKKKQIDIRVSVSKLVTPLRIQAYERLILLLERIAPSSLIMRISPSSEMSLRNYQSILTQAIRDEYEHNLSQQLYVSENLWHLTLSAKEEIVKIINVAASSLNENSSSLDLATKIIEMSIGKEFTQLDKAISAIRDEFSRKY